MYSYYCNNISIYVRACACRTVCQLKTDRCIRHGLNGARPAADIFPSCSGSLEWCQSSFANDASSSGSAWPLPWAFWRPGTPSRSRSDYP